MYVHVTLLARDFGSSCIKTSCDNDDYDYDEDDEINERTKITSKDEARNELKPEQLLCTKYDISFLERNISMTLPCLLLLQKDILCLVVLDAAMPIDGLTARATAATPSSLSTDDDDDDDVSR